MKLNYYALHYHMKQSGTRTVIENILQSLETNPEIKLNLIYSSKKGTFHPESKKIKVIDIPDVDYYDNIFKSKELLMKKANKLKENIKNNLELSNRCVLHCHNVNLFKNSYLAAALLLLAKELEDKNFILLLQLHDFAEENRPDRLRLLVNCSGKKDRLFGSRIAYPIYKNISYMTINLRDKALLKKIGIPENHIFLYPNSVDTELFLSKPHKTNKLIKRLENYAKENKYIFEKNRKILLCPTKILRRKNIIESIVILKLLNSIRNEWQLLITLEGNSQKDRAYGKLIKDYVRKKKLPATIGFGHKLIAARNTKDKNKMIDLFSISDAIITTSIQEGFGFTFLEAWVANKKVIGRRISYIFKELKANGLNMNHFYDKILINKKDFCEYSHHQQIRLLDKINYEGLLRQKQLKRMINFLKEKNSAIINSNKKIILKNFSISSYTTRLKKIITEAEKLKKKTWKNVYIDNKILIDYFKND
ncbi:MAG: glycosyltransferase [Nanoarchaeota archaeon]|nr:glycosyltransferase [Nanoarchaeota archaeon]